MADISSQAIVIHNLSVSCYSDPHSGWLWSQRQCWCYSDGTAALAGYTPMAVCLLLQSGSGEVRVYKEQGKLSIRVS